MFASLALSSALTLCLSLEPSPSGVSSGRYFLEQRGAIDLSKEGARIPAQERDEKCKVLLLLHGSADCAQRAGCSSTERQTH